jgi:gamma-tubulin complex component 5
MGTADDVDAMMSIHDAALKQIKDDALLGNRLKPIQECVLDILDLGVKLEQVYAKAASISRDNGEDSGTDMDDESTELEAEKAPERPLLGLKSDFDKHLRFICEGLRSVARASSNSQSSKWDMLADMLQTGIRENRW